MCIAGGAVSAFMNTRTQDSARQQVLRTIPAHEHIFFEGDERDHLYVVESGWVKLYRTLVDGQRQIVGFANRGCILGLESDVEYSNGCEAITPVQVRAIPIGRVVEICLRDGALADQLALLAASPGEGARTWLQESFTFSDIGKSEGVPGYNGSGFSVAGGIDIPTPSLDAFGVMINFSSGRYEQKTGGSNPVSTTATGIGLYGLKTWDNAYVRGAGQVSRVNLSSLRELDIISGERDNFRDDADVLDSQDISDTMTADWGGYSYAASASTGATFKRGSFYLRPELTADYFRLDQEAYRETALLNTNHLHYKELLVSGSYSEKPSDFEAAQALVFSGRFPAAKLVTHQLSLERATEAFPLMEQGSALKVCITPTI